MKAILVLLLLTFSVSVMAADIKSSKSIFLDESGELKTLANSLAECAGVFKAYSEYLKPTLPATAENLDGLKNGTQSSAIYLFTNIKMAKDNIKRKFGEAMPQVENIAYGAYTTIAMLIRN